MKTAIVVASLAFLMMLVTPLTCQYAIQSVGDNYKDAIALDACLLWMVLIGLIAGMGLIIGNKWEKK